MNEEELIQELRRLSIRQYQIVEQLHEIKSRRPDNPETNLKEGDTILLLTKGVRSSKGDKGVITKVNKATVHIKLVASGAQVTRKIKNVQKVL